MPEHGSGGFLRSLVRIQTTYVGYGVIGSGTGEGILDNAACHIGGGLHSVKGAIEDIGFLSYIRPDGDKVLLIQIFLHMDLGIYVDQIGGKNEKD
jgi:hypothetical protein